MEDAALCSSIVLQVMEKTLNTSYKLLINEHTYLYALSCWLDDPNGLW